MKTFLVQASLFAFLALFLDACHSPNAVPITTAPKISATNYAGTYVCSVMGPRSGLCYISGYRVTLESIGVPTRLLISTYAGHNNLDSARLLTSSMYRDSLTITGESQTVPGLSLTGKLRGDSLFGNLYDYHGEGGFGVAIRE